jgi:hypothetical protein
LKPRSRLSDCQGLETQIPSICLSKSWNPDPICPSVEVLKPRSCMSVCRGPETQILTNSFIVEYFCFGTYWNLFWKYGDFFFFFWPWKCGHFPHIFFHKNHLYESYLIFLVTKWQKNSPKKNKKTVV